MNLNKTFKDFSRLVQENQPEILAGVAVAGTAITAFLAARGGRKAQREIDNWIQIGQPSSKKEKLVFEAKVTWKCYIPAALSGTATVAAIIASAHTGRQRTAAAFAAYTLSERAFNEYKDAMREEVDEKTAERVREKVAERMVERQPPTETFSADPNATLCCELFTMRYFRADRESVNRAVDKVNLIAAQEEHALLDDFYDYLGLDYTSQSRKVGWTGTTPMSLKVTYVQGPKGEPCMAFEYNDMVDFT
jgi:hypothetical protein